MKRILGFLPCILFISCEALLVEDISDKSVTVLAPVNNAVLSEGNIMFNWQLLDDAELYQIQIASPSFQDATQVLLDSVIETNMAVKQLSPGAYQWRIKAMNSDYETDYTTVSFSVN